MALIGAIIGDIIGSRYEFPSMRPDGLDWRHCELFSDECEFTDDTVMSIATKYAINNCLDFAIAYRKFGKMYPDVGYGDMFEKWIHNENFSYKSYGNGSAMRVSYIGDAYSSITTVHDISKLSAECTHNTKDGILGATTVACVIKVCNSLRTKCDVIEFIERKTDYTLSTIDELRNNYSWNSICSGTVPAAIICFLESRDYESCIRNCLSLNCDMDTMCCIAGGIAEAYYGTTGLNNKTILKRYLDDFLYNQIKDLL